MKHPCLEAYLTVERFDASGRRVAPPRRQLSKSFLLQFIALLLMQFRQANYAGIIDLTGAGQISRISAKTFDAAASGSLLGLIVGTDGTAVDVEDFELPGLIADGVAAGELQHLAQTIDAAITVADPSASFNIVRDFLNSSGGLINVREVGLALQADTTAAWKNFLAIRDILTPISPVADGQNLRLTYTLQINT